MKKSQIKKLVAELVAAELTDHEVVISKDEIRKALHDLGVKTGTFKEETTVQSVDIDYNNKLASRFIGETIQDSLVNDLGELVLYTEKGALHAPLWEEMKFYPSADCEEKPAHGSGVSHGTSASKDPVAKQKEAEKTLKGEIDPRTSANAAQQLDMEIKAGNVVATKITLGGTLVISTKNRTFTFPLAGNPVTSFISKLDS